MATDARTGQLLRKYVQPSAIVVTFGSEIDSRAPQLRNASFAPMVVTSSKPMICSSAEPLKLVLSVDSPQLLTSKRVS
jgi:hypothetical protein